MPPPTPLLPPPFPVVPALHTSAAATLPIPIADAVTPAGANSPSPCPRPHRHRRRRSLAFRRLLLPRTQPYRRPDISNTAAAATPPTPWEFSWTDAGAAGRRHKRQGVTHAPHENE
eukprot:scaffold4387_cov126-Isochrysis_galbana.AAC.11